MSKPNTRLTRKELEAIQAAIGFVMAGEYPFDDDRDDPDNNIPEEVMESAFNKISERLRG